MKLKTSSACCAIVALGGAFVARGAEPRFGISLGTSACRRPWWCARPAGAGPSWRNNALPRRGAKLRLDTWLPFSGKTAAGSGFRAPGWCRLSQAPCGSKVAGIGKTQNWTEGHWEIAQTAAPVGPRRLLRPHRVMLLRPHPGSCPSRGSGNQCVNEAPLAAARGRGGRSARRETTSGSPVTGAGIMAGNDLAAGHWELPPQGHHEWVVPRAGSTAGTATCS